jgi:hypothetical protein
MVRKVQIRSGPGRHDRQLLIDGLDIADSVYRLEYRTDPDEVDQLLVDLLLLETDIEGEAVVEIPESTHRALVGLGWTPPPADGSGG